MKILVSLLFVAAFFSITGYMIRSESNSEVSMNNDAHIDLPSPDTEGKVSVEKAISKRRSVREFRDNELSLKDVSQLLWSAQGITAEGFYRTAPSAGALYPIELFLVAGEVAGLEPGVYRYLPDGHRLELTVKGDLRREIAAAALHQDWMTDAPAFFVFTAVYDRITGKYGSRGIRYAHMEAGYSGENLFLQCEAMELGTVVVGAFNDKELSVAMSLKNREEPLAIMPVGYKR